MTKALPSRPRLMPETTPDYMAPAWTSCLYWAIGEPDIRRQFFEATGRRWTLPRNALEQAIDGATGADKKFLEEFVKWFNENIWGDVSEPEEGKEEVDG
jgi:hypothetical protein